MVYKSEKKLTSMIDFQEFGPVTGVESMGPTGSSTPALRITPVRRDQVEIADATACWEVVESVLGGIEDAICVVCRQDLHITVHLYQTGGMLQLQLYKGVVCRSGDCDNTCILFF